MPRSIRSFLAPACSARECARSTCLEESNQIFYATSAMATRHQCARVLPVLTSQTFATYCESRFSINPRRSQSLDELAGAFQTEVLVTAVLGKRCGNSL